MTQNEALDLVDDHKNHILHPIEILKWTWLRVIILNIDPTSWDVAQTKAQEILSR